MAKYNFVNVTQTDDMTESETHNCGNTCSFLYFAYTFDDLLFCINIKIGNTLILFVFFILLEQKTVKKHKDI